MNLATLHRTVPTRFLPQEHHATRTDLIQGINISTPKGTDHTPPILVPDMGDISAGHSPATIPTVTKATVLEGTPCTPHPATTAALATLQLMDAPITTHAETPTGIVTPHPTLTTSPADVIHATPQTRAGPTALHRKHSQENPSHVQDCPSPHKPHHSKTVTFQDSPSDSSSDSNSDSDHLNY